MLKPVGHRLRWPGNPPFHFSCRCSVIPVLKSFADLAGPGSKLSDKKIRKLEKLSPQQRAAMTYDEDLVGIGKPVSGKMTYDGWLKTQPKAVQVDVLGPGRHRLWKEHKLSMADMVHQNGRPLSIKDLEDRYEEALALVAPSSPMSSGGVTNMVASGGGVNETFLVDMEFQGEELKGVWKPIDGENWSKFTSFTNRKCSLADREVMAYEIDQTIGLNLVPETVVREIGGRKGSLQRFVSDTVEEYSWQGRDLRPAETYRIGVFDYITGNADRHSGNYLRLKKNGKPVLIDNGFAFPKATGGYSNGLQEFLSEPMANVYQNLDKALTVSEKQAFIEGIKKIDVSDLRKQYGLSAYEANAMEIRIKSIVEKIQKGEITEFFSSYADQETLRGFIEGEFAAAVEPKFVRLGSLPFKSKALQAKFGSLKEYRDGIVQGVTPNPVVTEVFDTLTDRQKRKLLKGAGTPGQKIIGVPGKEIVIPEKVGSLKLGSEILKGKVEPLRAYRNAMIQGTVPDAVAAEAFNTLTNRQKRKLLIGIKKETIEKVEKVTIGVPEKKVPMPGKKWEWTDVDTVAHAQAEFRLLGWEEVGSLQLSDKDVLKAVNKGGETLTGLFARFPKLETAFRRKGEQAWSLQIEAGKTFFSKEGRGLYGDYSKERRRLRIANGLDKARDSLNVGVRSWNVGGDFASVLRHEYAHHFHLTIMNFDEKVEWQKVFDSFSKGDIKEKVSMYAGTNIKECFAESFAAYTSPKYGITGKRLPKKIEEFFDKYVGG